MKLDEYVALKRKVDKYQREYDRVRGALDNLYEELRNKFGRKTLEQAKRLLIKFKRRHAKDEKVFHKAMRRAEKQFGDKL